MLRRFRDEDGVALVTVVAMTGVLMGLVGVLITTTMLQDRRAHGEQSSQGAIAAAQAGIDDYVHRLNAQDAYWQYSSTTAPPDGNQAFSPSTCTKTALTTCRFVAVPGGASEGTFTYRADISELTTTGVITLHALGRVQNDVRSVRVALRQQSFLDFLYFTDYETNDPVTYGDASDVAWAETNCRRHRYDNPTRPSGCRDITWISGDVVNGPFHTNDRWVTSGAPSWLAATSGSSPSPLYTSSSGTPTYAVAPFYQPPLQLPPTNSAIRVQADYTVGNTGCLFTGPTQIVLTGATMSVRSPYTRQSGTGCGTWPRATAQTINIPANGVVYVQNVPSSGPNAFTGSSCPTSISSTTLPTPVPLGYPIASDVTTGYGCRHGDVFIEGNLDGRLTVAADDTVIITWNLTRQSSAPNSDDLLGLVANNFVQIYHPVDEDENNLDTRPGTSGTQTFSNPTIQAAMLSVGHSFIVQNYGDGSPIGTLNVFGAIAQLFRGPVGTFATVGGVPTVQSGYLKNYVYDTRLQFISPPHFLDPVAAEWRVRTWVEV